MIERLGSCILEYLLKNNAIEDDEEIIAYYRYGIEITISSLLNVLIIILIGLISKQLVESIAFLLCFIPIRQFTGGFHANSYLKCNASFALCFIILLIIYRFTRDNFDLYYTLAITILSSIVFGFECPVEHVNKKIAREKKPYYKIIAIILCVLYNMIAAVLQVLSYPVGVMITYTIALVSILVMLAVLRDIRREGKKHEGSE